MFFFLYMSVALDGREAKEASGGERADEGWGGKGGKTTDRTERENQERVWRGAGEQETQRDGGQTDACAPACHIFRDASVPYQLRVNFSISQYWILNCACSFFHVFYIYSLKVDV